MKKEVKTVEKRKVLTAMSGTLLGFATLVLLVVMTAPVEAVEEYSYPLQSQALQGMAYNGTDIYVAGGTSHKVYRVGAATGFTKNTYTFATDINPDQVTVMGNDVYVTDVNATNGYDLVKITPPNTTTTLNIDGQGMPRRIGNDGTYLYVLFQDSNASPVPSPWICKYDASGTKVGLCTTVEVFGGEIMYADDMVVDTTGSADPNTVLWFGVHRKQLNVGGAYLLGYRGSDFSSVGVSSKLSSSYKNYRGCGMTQDTNNIYLCYGAGTFWETLQIRKSTLTTGPFGSYGKRPRMEGSTYYTFDETQLKARNVSTGAQGTLGIQSALPEARDHLITPLSGRNWHWITRSNGDLVSFASQAQISNIAAAPSTTSATITWDTDIPMNQNWVCYSEVNSGISPVCTSPVGTEDETNHSVTIAGLSEAASYAYTVYSEHTTWSVPEVQSAAQQFTTQVGPPTDEIEPLQIYISNGPSASVSGTDVSVQWDTKLDPGNSIVRYGTLAPSGSAMAIDSGRLGDVDFAGVLRGWAVGDNGRIYQTTDAGSTWQAQNSGTTARLRAVSAVSEAIVWAAGDSGTILRTADGGATWVQQTSPYGTAQTIYDVFGFNSNVAWAVTSGGKVIQTVDAGKTWVEAAELSGSPLRDIDFVKSDDGLVWGCVAGDNGGLWRYDGGTSFSRINVSDATVRFQACAVAQGGFNGYWAVGESGNVWKASSLGATSASKLQNPKFVGQSFFDVQAYPGGRAFFVGSNSWAFYTDDEGLNWQLLNFNNPGKTFLGIALSDPLNVWIVGDGGSNYRYGSRYSASEFNGSLTNAHTMNVTAPLENTTYHYSVMSVATSSSAFTGSWDYTFDTQFSDTTPPDWANTALVVSLGCSGSDNVARIEWNGANDAESGVVRYDIYRRMNSSSFTAGDRIASVTPQVLQYTDNGPLSTNATYYYKVVAVNGAGLETDSQITSVDIPPRSFTLQYGPGKHKTVVKGESATYSMNVQANGCFNESISLSFVSAVRPFVGAQDITSAMVSFTENTPTNYSMTIATDQLDLGTYSDITVKGSAPGVNTQTIQPELASLTIESTDNTPPDWTNPNLSGFVQCNGTGREVVLNWDPAVDPDGPISRYDIYRKLSFSVTYPSTPLATVDGATTTYTDTTAEANRKYKYKIVAFNSGVPPMSVESNEIVMDTSTAGCGNDISPPTPPSLSVAESCAASNTYDANLSWTPATDTQSAIVKYEVFRNGSLITTLTGSPPPTSYTDAGLAPGTYTYRIDAWNDAVPPLKVSSNEQTITLAPDSVTVDVITPSTKSVTVPSGDPAQYTVQVAAEGCFSESVTMGFDTLNPPDGPAQILSTQVSFAPVTLNPAAGNGQAVMTVDTTGLPPGTYKPLKAWANAPSLGKVYVDQTPELTLVIDDSLCLDGTPNLTCKETITGDPADLPLYCDTGVSANLIDQCSVCGCPSWTGNVSTDRPYCNAETEACELKCSDGTPNLSCSTVTPGSYCDLSVSFDPIEDCTKCTDPNDGYCDAPNEMCNPETKQCETDDIPPALTCPVVCTADVDSMTVEWCTDEASTSVLRYGLTAALGSAEQDPALVTNHALTASNLNPNTDYYYVVESADQFGNLFQSSPPQLCSTTDIVDTVPPSCEITAPLAGETVSGTIDFTATATDNVGVVQVDFTAGGILEGTDASDPYGVLLDTTRFSDGTLQLTITGRDAANNTCFDEVFVTVSNDASAPQLVGDITVRPISNGEYVRVTWATDEPSDGYVAYGIEGTPQDTWQQVDYPLGINHDVQLGPLVLGENYGAVIWACDEQGNCGFLNF